MIYFLKEEATKWKKNINIEVYLSEISFDKWKTKKLKGKKKSTKILTLKKEILDFYHISSK